MRFSQFRSLICVLFVALSTTTTTCRALSIVARQKSRSISPTCSVRQLSKDHWSLGAATDSEENSWFNKTSVTIAERQIKDNSNEHELHNIPHENPIVHVEAAQHEEHSANAHAHAAVVVVVPEQESPIDDSTQRLQDSLPKIMKGGDALDKRILATAIPSMINLAVVPLVNSVDTFWVGRMGSALALAGQAAANQAFFTLYFLVAFLPTITAPLVAEAMGSGNKEAAQSRVCESLFLSNVLGGLGTLLLVGTPRAGLGLVLAQDAPAMARAIPYLRLRALSMVPALFSATGFAAYRGLQDTMTPLKVSLLTNGLNLVADPIFMFGLPVLAFKSGLGVAGAALATALSEASSGLIYLKLMLHRGVVAWSKLLKPPAWENLLPLIQGGLAMLARQATLNVAFLSAARRAQAMDPSGVAAAAYGIVMQIYSVGIVVHLAVQGTAAALVPAARASGSTTGNSAMNGESNELSDELGEKQIETMKNDAARRVADRVFVWGSIVGLCLGLGQLLALPYLVPLFSTLPEVQEAVKKPALISACIHVINGPVFAGEGTLLGLGRFRALATITAIGVSTMVVSLSTGLGRGLDGILLSLGAFCSVQAVGVTLHHLKIGPLKRGKGWSPISWIRRKRRKEASLTN